MQEEFRNLLKNYPLVASKNPELGLLSEEDRSKLQVRQSTLYRNLWNEQRKKLARYSTNSSLRKLVEPADRFRDLTRSHPVHPESAVEWPAIDFSGPLDDVTARRLRSECRSVMETPKQADELVDLLQEFGGQLAQALSEPCPVFEDRYAIRVELLDCIAWVALKIERQIRIELKDSKGNWQLSTLRFDLVQPMHLPTWLDQFLLPRVDRLVLLFGESAENAYDWLRANLESLFHNDPALSGIRRHISHHLCVNREMLEAGKVIKQQAGGSRHLLNTEVSALWPAAEFWAELYRKNPGLLLLCHLAEKADTPMPLRQFHRIRAFCLKHGLSPSGWKFLLREGEASYQPVVESGLTDSRAFFTAIKFIEWQNQAQLEHALPVELAVALINFAASSALERIDLSEQINPKFARLAVEKFQSLDSEDQRSGFIENELLEILIWMRNLRPEIDKNQWKSGWPAIRRKFDARAVMENSADEWHSEVRDMTLQGLYIKPLTSSKALCLEGITMRNCIATYAGRCKKGQYRVFSIRGTTHENQMATAGLVRRDGAWQLEQVKGKCNTTVDENTWQVAESLARFYQQASARSGPRATYATSPREQARRVAENTGSYHLKISRENRLLCRSRSGHWVTSNPHEHPISAELKAMLERRGQSRFGGPDLSAAELAIRLRLELPAGYSVYVWDEAKSRDRLLSLD